MAISRSIHFKMKKPNLFFALLLICSTTQAASFLKVDTFLATNPTIAQIDDKLRQHQFSCKDLIHGYLHRIRLYNLTTTHNATPLNAITQINPMALSDAENLDLKLNKNPFLSDKLFCIPVIVKDNIDVLGLQTSSGSLALGGVYPIKDAEIVRAIQKQGGIILAKSAMDEMAAGLFGMSSLSGRVGNAYNPSYNSGGSSAGSAVSVAAGFAPLAIGSDNSGSVRVPAAYNGIYGLRPTYGLISHRGLFPLGNLDATAGPMANNVIDLAKLLTVMTHGKTDYSQHLNDNSLKGKKLALITSVAGESLWEGMPAPIMAIYETLQSNLKKQGVTITTLDLPHYQLDRTNNMAGTVEEVDTYLARNKSPLSNFREICQGNTRVFGTPTQCLKFIDNIRSRNSAEYQQAIELIAQNQAYLVKIVKAQHLDGFILPSGKSGIASYDGNQIGDQSIIASNSGLPEITLPVAQYEGLPVGLEIMGAPNSEKALLNYAFAYQQHYYAFKAPVLQQDTQFTRWSIQELNQLYPLIGEISFNSVIKPANKNEVSAHQSMMATRQAIALLS
jgi:amidase